jgi:hypothetical protein
MLNMVKGAMVNLLLMNSDASIAVSASDVWLLTTRKVCNLYLLPLPGLYSINLEEFLLLANLHEFD